MKILHIPEQKPHPRIWTNTFRNAVAQLGELELIHDGENLSTAELAEHIRSADILATSWGSVAVPVEIARNPGKLKYICHVTGTMRDVVPTEIIQSSIPVTNWGNSVGFMVAEGAVILLMAMLKNLHGVTAEKEAGCWHKKTGSATLQMGTLRGLKIGCYGLGYIGSVFCDLLRPFGPVFSAYDPYAKELPEGVARANSLEELFGNSHAIVLHAGLTPETRGSVTAKLLSLLPDHAIIINTARGDIIDQEALFAELQTGRLRAGLDVLAGNDMLPDDHPALRWPNVIFTSHHVASSFWPIHPESPDAPLEPFHETALDNMQRFINGKPLEFVIDEKRYSLMT